MSSLAKKRQSWLDLVSQAGLTSAENAVSFVQVHTQGDTVQNTTNCSETAAALAQDAQNSVEPTEQALAQLGEKLITHKPKGEESNSDELEKLYRDLKRASLSPMGERRPSSKREFRASFIKRCKNHRVNDKLHLVRALNSTLKAKEADLLTLDQVLTDPALTATKFRRWKKTNMVLLQEMHAKDPTPPPQTQSCEASDLPAAVSHLTETSI